MTRWRIQWFWACFLVSSLCLAAPGNAASTKGSGACDTPSGACDPFEDFSTGGKPQTSEQGQVLRFFWGIGCPHCEQAKPFVREIPKEFPKLDIEWIEMRRDAQGRERFLNEVRRLRIQAPGIPLLVYSDDYVVGYTQGVTEGQILHMLRGTSNATARLERVELPLLGSIDPKSVGLPTLTLTIGLLDGVNPCAMWVLLVLLGIMMHVRSRSRLFLVGGLFVLMSGVVYFLFMTAWSGLFELAGMARPVTKVLGIVVLVMGIINLKELLWFKRGVSLTISDRAKPGLYRRMRRIANAASLPAAILGIVTLAFFVNLIELGCTLGLPAVYTRILSLREELSASARYAYIGLYNVAYVAPLAIIVFVYVVTLQRLALSERGAKVLKAISGTLLVSFGLLFLLYPELLD